MSNVTYRGGSVARVLIPEFTQPTGTITPINLGNADRQREIANAIANGGVLAVFPTAKTGAITNWIIRINGIMNVEGAPRSRTLSSVSIGADPSLGVPKYIEGTITPDLFTFNDVLTFGSTLQGAASSITFSVVYITRILATV